MKNLTLFLTVFTALSCDVKNSEEYQSILSENTELKLIIDSLKNTSENRFNYANNLLNQGQFLEAVNAFEYYIDNYEESYYYPKAKIKLAEAQGEFKKKKREEERRARLKFKALEIQNPLKIDSISIQAYDFNFTKDFTFDRYGDRYFYRRAERGNKFLSFDVSVSSESKNPNLPLFYVYVFEEDKLVRLSGLNGMTYEFYRWDDYGSYLGNDADYGNDFSRTKKIRFDVGEQLEISKYEGKEIYLVMSKKEYAYRRSTLLGNPEIQYRPFSVDVNITEILDLETFEKNFYLVKRL